MARIEELAAAVLARDALRARSLVQDLAREGVDLAHYPSPIGATAPVATMTAALVELLAVRNGVPAPAWARQAGALPEPFYANAAALRSPKLRARCEVESPEPLRRRNVFALGEFLTFA